MPGSSSTPSTTATAINAIVGKVLSEYADKLEKSDKENLDKTKVNLVKTGIKSIRTQKIRQKKRQK